MFFSAEHFKVLLLLHLNLLVYLEFSHSDNTTVSAPIYNSVFIICATALDFFCAFVFTDICGFYLSNFPDICFNYLKFQTQSVQEDAFRLGDFDASIYFADKTLSSIYKFVKF